VGRVEVRDRIVGRLEVRDRIVGRLEVRVQPRARRDELAASAMAGCWSA
jgi:hypothetical protein